MYGERMAFSYFALHNSTLISLQLLIQIFDGIAQL